MAGQTIDKRCSGGVAHLCIATSEAAPSIAVFDGWAPRTLYQGFWLRPSQHSCEPRAVVVTNEQGSRGPWFPLVESVLSPGTLCKGCHGTEQSATSGAASMGMVLAINKSKVGQRPGSRLLGGRRSKRPKNARLPMVTIPVRDSLSR